MLIKITTLYITNVTVFSTFMSLYKQNKIYIPLVLFKYKIVKH